MDDLDSVITLETLEDLFDDWYREINRSVYLERRIAMTVESISFADWTIEKCGFKVSRAMYGLDLRPLISIEIVDRELYVEFLLKK